MDRAQEGFVPGFERLTGAPVDDALARRRVARLLEPSRYEVLPLDGVEEQVLEHVPRDVTMTVTASPTKGLEPTFASRRASSRTATRSCRTSRHV